MKFLCIACNTQMKLIKSETNTVADSKGSLSVKWECPDCLYEMGMLTNPYETQLVSSIGVEIGGNKINKEGASESQKAEEGKPSQTSSGAKCPFPETVRDAMINSAREGGMAPNYVPDDSGNKNSQSNSHGMDEAQELKSAMGFATSDTAAPTEEVTWTAQAMVRLQNIPEFIRPVAKKGIEKFALGKGTNTVDEGILDQAKDHFNM